MKKETRAAIVGTIEERILMLKHNPRIAIGMLQIIQGNEKAQDELLKSISLTIRSILGDNSECCSSQVNIIQAICQVIANDTLERSGIWVSADDVLRVLAEREMEAGHA